MISPVHFVRGLFCYSNFNFFYVYDKEETNFRSSRTEVKKGVLRNFAKFTGKHLCQSFFLIKLQAWGELRPEDLWKSDFTKNFKNIFYAYYKDTRITFLKHSSDVDFEHVFVCWGFLTCFRLLGNFRRNSQINSEKWPYFYVQEFWREYMTKIVHSKRVLFEVKA